MLELETGSAVLGRVVGVPFGGATATDDVIDVTEYLHEPQGSEYALCSRVCTLHF